MVKEELKKHLQKVCKKIRQQLDSGEYPKAVMTCRQMELNTGNINCSNSEELREEVMDTQLFKDLVKKWGLKVEKEATGGTWNCFIIRIRY